MRSITASVRKIDSIDRKRKLNEENFYPCDVRDCHLFLSQHFEPGAYILFVVSMSASCRFAGRGKPETNNTGRPLF